MKPGRFITLEGGEGAGKSTWMDLAGSLIEAAGHRVIKTREPGGTKLAEAVRNLLLDPANADIDDKAELLLVFAARADHLAQVIRPALARGDWLLCDRFTDASFAYQGHGRGLDLDALRWMEQWVHGDLQPDRTLLLDVDPAVGLGRATRDRDADRFERQDEAFYQRIRAGYLQRAKADPARFCIIDAGRDLASVEVAVRDELTRCLERWA